MTPPNDPPQSSQPPRADRKLLWIHDLAQRVSGLSEDQLRILAIDVHTNPTILKTSTRLQRILSLPTTEAVQLARNLEMLFASVREAWSEPKDVAVALEALAAGRSLKVGSTPAVEVVCTAPSRLGIPVRATFPTAVEMVQAAREEVLVVGYVFTEGAKELMAQLAIARRDQGVRVTFVGNRMQDQLPVLRAIWSADGPAPDIFSRQVNHSDPMTSLHAKLLICDGIDALVTSANFSHHGLHDNIEIGVRVQSQSVARLVDFVQAMIIGAEVKPVQWIP